MSVSDSWGRREFRGGGSRDRSEAAPRPAERGASERSLAELADRLAEARQAGDPAPEELERLVDMLARNEVDPGDRLTRALEGFARLSEERRRVARPERKPESYRGERPVPGPQPGDPRRQPAPAPIPNEVEAHLTDFARTLPSSRPEAGKEAPARAYTPEPRQARAPEPRSQAKAAPTPPIASLRAALAEISARQKTLDAEVEAPVARAREPEPRRSEPAPRAAPAYALPAPKPAPDLSVPLQELRAELDRMGRSVADLPTRAEIDRMTREMAGLAQRLTDDRPARLDRDSLSAIDQLVSEVDRMRADAPSPQVISKLAEEVHAISARLEVLGPRSSNAIDSIARRVDDVRAELDQFPRVAAVDAVAHEIHALIGRLDAQEAIARPTREAVVGLAGRVQAMDGQIAAIAEAAAARDEALERINTTIRTELDDLPRAAAVSDLGRQIDALTEGLKSRSAIGPALKAVEGLADKVEALDDKIAAIASFREEDAGRLTELVRGEFAAASRPEAFEKLGRRIEALDDRVASIASRREEEAGWLSDSLRDEIAAVARPAAFDELSRQIEEINERLAEDRRAPDPALDSLTFRIDELGARFESMTTATRTRGAALEQIEESIRAIAEQLLVSRSPSAAGSSALEAEVVRLVEGLEQNDNRIEDLHHAFTGLAGRIERSCADLGAHAVQSAVAAARDVLGAETSDVRLESELASALAELRASSAQSERRAADALDAVRSTLEHLLDRMENQPEPARHEPPVPPYRQFGLQTSEVENATEAARAAAMRAMEEIADTPRPSPVRAPQTDEPDLRYYGDFGPDHPLEPGAGQPRAENETVQPAPQSAASLIASARRAKAQTAADPLEDAPAVGGPEKRASPFSGALATIRKSKRPILFGVAAVLIVFTAIYVASGMTGEAEQAPPAPQSRVAPADEPRVGALGSRVDAAPKTSELAAVDDREDASGEFAAAEDPEPKSAEVAAQETATPETPKVEAPKAPVLAEAPKVPPAEKASEPVASQASIPPRAPARDLTGFAFAEASAASKSRADWKMAEPAATGSISRDPFALPDAIGGATLKSRAQAGDPAAEVEVGDRLLDGRGVPADAAAAARWFAKAAAQGSAPAQHRLGSLYEKGRGVARDVPAARRWYEQAAASGNVRAMHNLGVVHAEGGLGKPDYGAAMVWFRMAAERGLNDSGYNLAVLAARGLGGKRDMVEAYKWFALAAEQGDEDAAKKRDEVGKALGSTITVAKAAVASFKPKPVDPAANEPETPPGGWDRVATRAKDGGAGPVAR
ncbi:SEL1-like repeat protein [Methylopila sp. M107]|uniref:SEL1-like repeat protein n=1 Tax=Methylopila sp. M107 TaxID=1101190 RepID=UPI000376A967|nr:SEL1-like repeat protein [Methylopila sp. M107]